jgi:hypothetical protein
MISFIGDVTVRGEAGGAMRRHSYLGERLGKLSGATMVRQGGSMTANINYRAGVVRGGCWGAQ